MKFRGICIGTIATIALALAGGTASAQTITVTTTGDLVNMADGNCSLREAITSANANSNVNDCADGDSAIEDVILLQAPVPPSTYALTGAAGEDANASGDFDVSLTAASGSLTIRGRNATLGGLADTIDAGGLDRALDAQTGPGTLTLDKVRIKGGVLGSGSNGGGVRARNGASLAVLLSRLVGNRADTGGAIYFDGSSASTLVVTDSAIGSQLAMEGNVALASGGGISAYGSTTLLRVRIEGNSANEGAGPYPVHVGGGMALSTAVTSSSIRDTTFVANHAISTESPDSSQGGGLFVNGGMPLEITGTTIVANDASSVAGGFALGGGISFSNTPLKILNSTFSQNSTAGGGTQNGGALLASGSETPTLIHSSVSGNTSAGLDGISTPGVILRGSIIDEGGEGCASPAVANAYNVDAGSSCVGIAADSDLPVTPPLLSALAGNGGPTSTFALNSSSPAIDLVPAASCQDLAAAALLVDQRGAERPFGAACDAGSYERVTCDGALPTILGGPGNDTLPGGSGPDVIVGSAGNDTIDADDGADKVCGGSGNDQITGGPGADHLFGESGNDNMLAQDGEADIVDCGPGTDTFLADTGLDTLIDCVNPVAAAPGGAAAIPAASKATCPKGKKLKKVKRKRKCVKKKKKK